MTLAKCTIELEPICYREASEVTVSTSCAVLFSSSRAFQNVNFQVQRPSGLISMNGPSSPAEFPNWLSDFNDSLSADFLTTGQELCVQNEFGIEQTAYLVPHMVDNGISATGGGASSRSGRSGRAARRGRGGARAASPTVVETPAPAAAVDDMFSGMNDGSLASTETSGGGGGGGGGDLLDLMGGMSEPAAPVPAAATGGGLFDMGGDDLMGGMGGMGDMGF